MDKVYNSKVVMLFIFLQPILDLVTSLMVRPLGLNTTLGILVRSIFMFYLIIYVLVVHKYNKKNKVFYYLMIFILLYFLIYSYMNFRGKSLHALFYDIKGLLKTFYFPILTISLFLLNRDDKIDITSKNLSIILLVYTAVIFIATVSGTYYGSYSAYLGTKGSVGWFYAANEIGSIVAILTPFTIINFIKNEINIFNLLSMFMCIMVCMYMGTKVPFLGLVVSIFIIFIFYCLKFILKINIKTNNFKRYFLHFLYVFLMFGVIFYKSPIYQNIDDRYGDTIRHYLHIDNKSQDNLNNDSEKEKQIEKEKETEKDIIKLLSGRDIYEREIRRVFNNSTIPEKIFGIGYFTVHIDSNWSPEKTIELDYHEIFYRHGFVGTMIYFLPIIFIIGYILKEFCKYRKVIYNEDFLVSIISIFIGVGIGGFAGHVLTAPSVSIFLVVTLLFMINLVRNEHTDKI